MMMISNHLTLDLISLFGLPKVSEDLSMTTWNLSTHNTIVTNKLHAINSLPKVNTQYVHMSEPLPGGDALLLESYKQPPLVGDLLIFTFSVVAYGRFDCINLPIVTYGRLSVLPCG